MTQSYFYDEQIRRFLLQFTRIFSGFQVQYGREDGSEEFALLRVPVRYGDASRNAQTIIQENSRNSLPSTPLMTFYIAGLDYDRPRMQDPYFVSKIAVRQRTYDPDTDSYETTQGNAFTIERLMPVPYKMTINLDIWTSNTHQKFQLVEQIATLFNPSLEIQSTDNYIDWTSLSVLELESTQFSSRTIPMGTENPIDICTMRFNLPIWISSPAKLKKLGVVERIVASVFDSQGDANEAINDNDLLLGTRQKITPFGYKLAVIDNQIQCLQSTVRVPNGSPANLDPTELVSDSNLLWPAVIDLYGKLRPGISQIRLERRDGSEIIGTITINPNDDRLVIFDVDPDTTPQNTLPPIDAIIDPLISGPGSGLPPAANGQRYLLTQGTGADGDVDPAVAWVGESGRNLIARANDIIEYTSQRWRVIFNAQSQAVQQYVTNITTGIQYEWNGEFWQKSYQGVYPGGTWSIVL
jgi:hypothetical protein